MLKNIFLLIGSVLLLQIVSPILIPKCTNGMRWNDPSSLFLLGVIFGIIILLASGTPKKDAYILARPAFLLLIATLLGVGFGLIFGMLMNVYTRILFGINIFAGTLITVTVITIPRSISEKFRHRKNNTNIGP